MGTHVLPNENEVLLTVRDVAERLCVPVSWVRKRNENHNGRSVSNRLRRTGISPRLLSSQPTTGRWEQFIETASSKKLDSCG